MTLTNYLAGRRSLCGRIITASDHGSRDMLPARVRTPSAECYSGDSRVRELVTGPDRSMSSGSSHMEACWGAEMASPARGLGLEKRRVV